MSISMKRPIYAAVVIMTTLVPSACMIPTFSDMQSAKLAGPGRLEVTPGYSMVGSDDPEGGFEFSQNHYAIQVATGLAEGADLRVRYERLQMRGEDDGANVVAIGPKFAIVPDRLAINLPVGFGFGDGIDAIETLSTHPALIGTATLSPQVELTGAVKALVPLRNFDREVMVAANIGAGISTDLDRWALRPEIGFLKNPGDDGYGMQLSVGLTMYLGGKSDTATAANERRWF